ncbi:hypothetical protein Z968_11235 [Clostridium novyi A str. 4552]|uniref:Bacteriophage lysin domain-containing protein n=1 Tax=Clostridium novyi A str. 4552 TaxID=1444289 RepID=A0A0A0I1P7_CLONO|nr:hypothetical protein [Clostridium novyi]KGM94702.1 hypothetical protein Z968_11235 [Clostridium novyi A str. 4552]
MTKNKFNNKFSNLESSENTKKYVKEMYDLAEKHEKRSFMSFIAIGIPIAVILILVVVQMISFSVHSSKNKQVASKSEKNNSVTNKFQNNLSANQTKPKIKLPVPVDANLTPANEINAKIFNYLKVVNNRFSSYNKAKKLNNNNDKGLASIYVAQILRDTGYNISDSIINTAGLVNQLKKDGWKPITDYKQLRKGDICFTTSDKPNGSPAHTYIFITWVTKGKTDFAWVIDSQVSDYKNVYHKRNIDCTTSKKEKFAFFMRK